ncbi:MAG: hypothetical protein Alpg2KO_21870 [Alphaproteobacteria bacterium]
MGILQRITLGIMIGLFIGGGYWAYQQHQISQGQATDASTASAPGEVQIFGSALGGPIALTSHTGQPYDTAATEDTWHLIFFGFTFCPDICPGELATIARAVDQLPADKLVRLQPLFVSVDPERDTVKLLSEYVPVFHDKFIGLTGTKDQIEQIKKAYAVYAAKAPVEEGQNPDMYLVNHSANIYLVNPSGEVKAVFRQGVSPDELAKGLMLRL